MIETDFGSFSGYSLIGRKKLPVAGKSQSKALFYKNVFLRMCMLSYFKFLSVFSVLGGPDRG